MRRVVVCSTGFALVVCYLPIVRGMFDQWIHDEDMGHGFVVPLVIAWIVWSERSRWKALPVRPTRWGLVLLAFSACVHFMSSMGAGLFAGSVALVVSVAGAVLCLGGFAFLRFWTFPFSLALFMLPKLAVVYNQITLPLQLLASRLAEIALVTAGIGVVRDGNIMTVGGHSIEVAAACSGIRYLLSLGFVAVVFAHLSDAKRWMPAALLAAAVPVAIIANAIRVAAAASVPALDSGTPHEFAGWLVFALCLTMLIVVQRVLNAAYAHYHA